MAEIIEAAKFTLDSKIFHNQFQSQDNKINLFTEDRRQVLLYMRTFYGHCHVFTLKATAIAIRFARIHENFLKIYKHFQ